MVVPAYASEETVIAPVAASTLIGVVAAKLVTPVLVKVTAPVALDTLIAVPATAEVTPVLVIVNSRVPPRTAVIAVPAVKVTDSVSATACEVEPSVISQT